MASIINTFHMNKQRKSIKHAWPRLTSGVVLQQHDRFSFHDTTVTLGILPKVLCWSLTNTPWGLLWSRLSHDIKELYRIQTADSCLSGKFSSSICGLSYTLRSPETSYMTVCFFYSTFPPALKESLSGMKALISHSSLCAPSSKDSCLLLRRLCYDFQNGENHFEKSDLTKTFLAPGKLMLEAPWTDINHV